MALHPTRRIASALLVMTASGLLPLVPLATPAQANTPLVHCIGQEVGTYTPGLTLLELRDVHYTADIDYALCPTSDGVTSAAYHEAGFLPDATCIAVPSSATATITWKALGVVIGTSTVHVTGTEVDAVGAAQVYTSIGTVTSGRYAGRAVNIVVTLLIDLDDPAPCLTEQGLTRLSGPSLLTIV